ncbi:MAG: prolipoprotein diacylglyceryl transferase [Myxococcota bacterium]
MLPTLTLFGLALPTYAILMTAGYLAALGVVLSLTAEPRPHAPNLERRQVIDLFIVMLIASLIGAKLGHVLFEAPGHVLPDGTVVTSVWELLRHDPWHPFRLGEGGYVWYGGMLGALGTAAVYFRRRPHLNGLLYADAFAPAVLLGAFLGRLGCFCSGCCYGIPTDMPWGVIFPATHGQSVHPTQLYDAAVGLIGGGLLWAWFGRRRFDGQNLALLLMIYGLARFATEAFRGDPGRGSFGPLSTSQALSIPVFLAGVGLYRWAARRAASTPAVPGRDPAVAATLRENA